ncbi:hypothetical protein BO94DRAFT_369110 [Aspergillus sclerotioniger CBS 115572]|uniref:Uncharacterized protein n=1 Tax=Aspergillus sclerotioniger CBS 115572 TaxID=1450535 RepID=A0A317X9P1_9EURO|nr:hypothetical protein BO94DRAFT_369110 [Aspergillus sclerotioniger CBS 115572]PWY93290.1 hypothetical protein BO94DRAFT_369110 [Aspergillus sclerotioniger CBS 115572]
MSPAAAVAEIPCMRQSRRSPNFSSDSTSLHETQSAPIPAQGTGFPATASTGPFLVAISLYLNPLVDGVPPCWPLAIQTVHSSPSRRPIGPPSPPPANVPCQPISGSAPHLEDLSLAFPIHRQLSRSAIGQADRRNLVPSPPGPWCEL